MSNNHLLKSLLLAVILIAGCKPELKELKFDNNSIDFSKFVALGSSYTAGYQNNALFDMGQQNSFAAILAGQLKKVGGGEFLQPLVSGNDGAGFNFFLQTYIPQTKLNYGTTCNATPGFFTFPSNVTDIVAVETYIGNNAPYNNMGVPGMKSSDLDNANFGSTDLLLSKNPFYSRFATNPETSTVLTDAVRQLPTFFSFWVGFNDIYDCAMAGSNQTLATITPLVDFQNNINNALTSLIAGNRKGVVANIPDLLNLPYFTSIAYNALVLTEQQAQDLNTLYASNNPPITFQAGNNPLVISDPSAASGRRQMKPGELVLLPVTLDSINCAGWGSNTQKPLGNRFVLTTSEINTLRNTITSYNNYLKTKAEENNLAYVDMYAFFKKISSGYPHNGVTYSSEFLKGQFFSLDGITPTGRGSALIANEFIKAINEKYQTRIPQTDANSFPGILLP
ncbi:MAG TPA: SGNH/GDSL hydrolase family protein [Bacteroidia bacterium]|nr:SGNH/GDSL hydrolase family protein [Bacteroidia bacterium]HRU16619.1 SGNH/GDSL hydrolase family protein [Bacteroidia bacterium]